MDNKIRVMTKINILTSLKDKLYNIVDAKRLMLRYSLKGFL